MFRRKKISFRDTLLTKKKTSPLHAIYYEIISNSIFYSNKVFLKYASLGLVGTLVHLIILVFLTEIFHFFYLFSAFIGIMLGIYVNFLLNKKYIVRERGYKQKQINSTFTAIYFGISITTIFLNLFILVIFVEKLNIGYLLANIISSFLMFLTRFFGHRLLFNTYGH